ncbi:ankyrin repeat-containing domain protein, partial [Lophiotrema nucula]
LHLAAARGDVRSVKELLEGGSDVNAQDAMGRTALYLAVLRDHEEVVRTLLERGAGI